MTTERERELQIIALTFNTEQEHKRYWSERMPELVEHDEIPELGSYEHFAVAVTDFCNRNLPTDTPPEILREYKEAIAGSDTYTNDSPAERKVFTGISLQNLLTHSFTIMYGSDMPSDKGAVIEGMRAGYKYHSAEFESVYEVYQKDPETFWKLILTQTLTYYCTHVAKSNDFNREYERFIPHKFLIEELIMNGRTPFKPEEYQVTVDKYLTDRIKSDYDRLDPLSFSTEK